MPPKKNSSQKRNSNNNGGNQAKLKYKETCINSLINSLPKQTFSHIFPVHFETTSTYIPTQTNNIEIKPQPNKSRSKKNKSSSALTNQYNSLTSLQPSSVLLSSTEPVILSDPNYNLFPVHPNIYIQCVFCKHTLPAGQCVNHYVEHPQARRRFTPICQACYKAE